MVKGYNIIGSKHKEFKYVYRPNTKSSYSLVEGDSEFLPPCLTLRLNGVKGSINTRRELKGALNGYFAKSVSSPYKGEWSSCSFHSAIFPLYEYPLIYGYGDVSVIRDKTKANPKQRNDSKDLFLLVLESGAFTVHLFKGMKGNHEKAAEYLEVLLNKRG